jgi:hypothetical protein
LTTKARRLLARVASPGSGANGDLVDELADAVGGDLEADGDDDAVGGEGDAGGGDDDAVAAQVDVGGGCRRGRGRAGRR